ncbi:MAG: metallophosphoesterase [Clostridia bacterium]|nr:metallophosphoesterase [Clostridia bacterium]
MLKTNPAVFAVENDYQIMVEVEKPSVFRVKVGDRYYYDESNGIMRSQNNLHRCIVPQKALNEAKEYTVCVRPLIERKPYFTTTEPEQEFTYNFRPVPEKEPKAYHISDAHNRIETPIKAAKIFGDIDFLILNGDVIDHSGNPEKFKNIYEICSGITNGECPIVFSRGNHDMRGNFAEKFAEYTPNFHGNTYYTFRLGSIWGILLDCGEDKDDFGPEYGFTVYCKDFRRRQTEVLKQLIENADSTYNAEGVKTRVVVSHNPFSQKLEPPFDIEGDVYTEWCELLKEHVKPHVMICGHIHDLEVRKPGCDKDHYGQPCDVVIGATCGENYFAGCGYVFGENEITVQFTDSNGEILETQKIAK